MSDYTPSELHDAVADAFTRRGWVDDGTAVPAIVQAADHGKREAADLAKSAPATFLGRNQITRSDLEGALVSVVQGGFTLAAMPSAQTSITVSGGTNVTVAVGSVIGKVENVAKGIASEDARDALVAIARAIERDATLQDAQRLELLERVEFLSEQAASEPETRSKPAVKDVLVGMARAVEISAAVATVWQVAGPVITKFFGF